MISLITSLYKSETYLPKYFAKLKKCADFIIGQNMRLEVLIISNDASELEKKYLDEFKKSHEWIKVFYVPRESLYASWNRGVNLARYDIIGFWNVDDVRYPEAVIDGVKRIKEGAELVYFPFWYLRYVKIFGFRILVKKKLVKPPIFDRKEFTRSMHCGPFFIFRKSLYDKVGPFDEQFKIVGDFDWCVRAAKIGNFTLSSKIAGVFVNEGTSLSGSKNSLHVVENNIVYSRHGIKEKNQPVGENIMKEYNPDKIVYKNK